MSVGRDSFKLQGALGNWVAIAFRVKLNDVGTNNGTLTLLLVVQPLPESSHD